MDHQDHLLSSRLTNATQVAHGVKTDIGMNRWVDAVAT